MRQITQAALGALLLAGCAGGGTPTQLPPLGTLFSGSMNIGNQQVPLPPGQWVVRGSSESYMATGPGGIPMPPTNFIALINRTSVNPYFIFVRSIAGDQLSWQASRRCSPKNSIISETIINQDGGDQDCWWIKRSNIRRAMRKLSSNKQSHYYESAKQVSEWARRADVTFPTRGFVVGYHMADTLDILGVDYFFDPTQSQGVLPASEGISYTNRLKAWGNDWHSIVISGFHGELLKQRGSVVRKFNALPEKDVAGITSSKPRPERGCFGRTPLPDEYKIENNEIVKQDFRRFLGIWQGKWSNARCHVLIVTKIGKLGSVEAIYSYGGIGANSGGFVKRAGNVIGNRLSIDTYTIKNYYEFIDGELAGSWERNNSLLSGRFTKVN